MIFKCKFIDGSIETFETDVPYSLAYFMETGKTMDCIRKQKTNLKNIQDQKIFVNFKHVLYAYKLADDSVESQNFKMDEK